MVNKVHSSYSNIIKQILWAISKNLFFPPVEYRKQLTIYRGTNNVKTLPKK